MNYLDLEATKQEINEATSTFCPFGYLDIQTATNAALQAGKGVNFVYDSVSEFADSCGVKIEDCDPVYCVMDSILQEARNEICEITNFDISNDCTNGEIYTAGNFMCTSYDYTETAKEELINALSEKSVIIKDLNNATKYFLSQIEINQDIINELSQEIK